MENPIEITPEGEQTRLLAGDAHHPSLTQLSIIYLDRTLDVVLNTEQVNKLIEVLQSRLI